MQNNLANLRAWFSWLGDLKHLAVVCSVIPRQFSKCLFLESPSSPAFTPLSVFYSHQNDTLVLTHWHSGLSWANVYPCITAQVLGINCYREPLGDVLLMSWLPDALSSQLTRFDTGCPRAASSKPTSVDECHSTVIPGLWNPSSSTAPLPRAHPQAHPPSAGLHPWAANGLSTCLRLNICLKSSYPEWDWVWAQLECSFESGLRKSFFCFVPHWSHSRRCLVLMETWSRIGHVWLLSCWKPARSLKVLVFFFMA